MTMNHAKYVLLTKAEELTGYSIKAMNQKIDSGVWREGDVWLKAPDGRRLISMEGYHRWVETGLESSPAKRRSKSASPLMESHAV